MQKRRRANKFVVELFAHGIIIIAIMVISLAASIRGTSVVEQPPVVIQAGESTGSTDSDIRQPIKPTMAAAEPDEVSIYPCFSYSKDWSNDDAYLLAKVAECEAGNQSVETRAKVILVVLNRVWSSQFPDDIESVIMQVNASGTYQFSPVAPGGSWWYTEPSEKSWEAVELVLTMKYDTSEGALYFESFPTDEEAANSWHGRALTLLYKSGDMRFYK